jgi:hypothetical protein
MLGLSIRVIVHGIRPSFPTTNPLFLIGFIHKKEPLSHE